MPSFGRLPPPAAARRPLHGLQRACGVEFAPADPPDSAHCLSAHSVTFGASADRCFLRRSLANSAHSLGGCGVLTRGGGILRG